jgi:hypothetical protein
VKAVRNMTVAELAAHVSSQLRANGVDVVLSGGACVTIYSRGKYVSMDLDLVNIHLAKWRPIREAMATMGFREEKRHFGHPETEFLVEFPPGPLAIGEEPVKGINEVALSTGTLRMISPTECVKDRLAGYYHWQDRQCLEQAVLVAQATRVDVAEIERWSAREGRGDEFRQIKGRLVAGPSGHR